MENLIKTSEKIAVANYPYGFKLKTTLFDEIEFNPKKGYRHTTTTINPKTNKLNKPKHSTYYALIIRHYDEKGHIKTFSFDFNGDEAINKGMKFINENFDLFTTEEIKYLYKTIYDMSKVVMKATATYGGSKVDDLIPLYSPLIKKMVEGFNNPLINNFDLLLDTQAIEATKPAGFNPFKVVRYGLD